MTAIVVLAGFGLLTGLVGRRKGSSFWIWFAVGFFLPPFGLIAALLYRVDHDEPSRRCPKCGQVHKLYIQVCTSCGEDMYLPDPEEVWTPSSGEDPRGP